MGSALRRCGWLHRLHVEDLLPPPSDAAGSAEVEAEAARELSLRGRRILAASFGKHPGTPPRRVPLTRRESDSSAEGAARVYPERPARLSSRG